MQVHFNKMTTRKDVQQLLLFVVMLLTSMVILSLTTNMSTFTQPIIPHHSQHGIYSRQAPPYRISPCTLKTHLVYVKTHKTGSTTVGSIINRFGLARNLSFLLYKKDPTNGHFRQTTPKRAKDLLPLIGVKMGDYARYRGYDLMTSHIRLLPSKEFLQEFMAGDSKYVTVIREPAKQWESAFFFFSCPGQIRPRVKNRTDALNTFLSNPAKYWNSFKGSQCKYYTRNGMWFDLSANSSIHTDTNAVSALLPVLDQKLDLVLITEYLDESLLLLKRLMCWDFRDIVYVLMNQRNQTSVLNAEARDKIAVWNQADTILYDHFNQTLWRKIKEYGPEFQQDLDHFRATLREYEELCGITSANKEGTHHRIRKLSQNNSLLCQSLVESSANLILSRQNGKT